MFVDFIKYGHLKVEFGYKNVDTLNYFINYDVMPELRIVANENYKLMQISKEFINGGYFEINSPKLINLPLKVNKINDIELITVKYTEKTDSFLISRAVNVRTEVVEIIKEVVKPSGKSRCRCIIF